MQVPPFELSYDKETPLRSRRSFLTTLGGASIISLTGCVTSTADRPRYRLAARSLGSTLVREFAREPHEPFKALDQDLISESIAQGATTTAGVRLSNTGGDGLAYVKRDGTYYEISVTESGTVTREKWLLWFDQVDSEPPATAEVYSSGLGLGQQTSLDTTYGLAELDVHSVETAEGRMAPEHGFIDLESEPAKHRGYLFLRRSPEETDLVPEPPFTHVAFESGDGTVYARVVVERVAVELTQFTHTATPVGDSDEAFNEYLRKKYLQSRLSSEELSREQRSLLSSAQSNQGYEEAVPLSDGFAAILEEIGVADLKRPKPKFVDFSDDVYLEYGDAYYEPRLEIFG